MSDGRQCAEDGAPAHRRDEDRHVVHPEQPRHRPTRAGRCRRAVSGQRRAGGARRAGQAGRAAPRSIHWGMGRAGRDDPRLGRPQRHRVDGVPRTGHHRASRPDRGLAAAGGRPGRPHRPRPRQGGALGLAADDEEPPDRDLGGVPRRARVDQPTPGDRIREQFWRHHDVDAIARTWAGVVGPDRLTVVTVPPSGAAPYVLWERFCDRDRSRCRRVPRRAGKGAELVARVRRGGDDAPAQRRARARDRAARVPPDRHRVHLR